MTTKSPSRGEIWWVNLDPTRGHEQAGRRPSLVVSANELNHGAAGLVVVLPITSKPKGIPLHVELHPPEGGVRQRSFVKCEDIRSVAKERLASKLGTVGSRTMAEVEQRLKLLLRLN